MLTLSYVSNIFSTFYSMQNMFLKFAPLLSLEFTPPEPEHSFSDIFKKLVCLFFCKLLVVCNIQSAKV